MKQQKSRLRTGICLPFIYLVLTAFAWTQKDNQFLEGFPDIPLLEGFSIVSESAIIFDTPAGTIAETKLSSHKDNPLKLYYEAMAALGWICTIEHTVTCIRGSDTLEISMTAHENTEKILKIKISPAKYN